MLMASPKLSQIHNFQRGWAQIFNHLLRNGLCDSVVCLFLILVDCSSELNLTKVDLINIIPNRG